jgi:hypothetical protein
MSGRRPEILDGQVAPAARTAWPRAVFMARPFRSWEGWPSSDGWIRCRLKPGCGSAPEEQPCRLRRQRIAGSGRNICPGAVRFTRSSSHHDQTISFYRDVLGLPVVEEFADSFGEDGTIFGLPDTHVQLEIVRGSRVTSQNPPAHPAGSQGLSAHRLPVMDLWQRLEPCAYVPCRPSDTPSDTELKPPRLDGHRAWTTKTSAPVARSLCADTPRARPGFSVRTVAATPPLRTCLPAVAAPRLPQLECRGTSDTTSAL